MNKIGSKSQSHTHEALVDLRLSWNLYKANFRVFLGAQLINILIFLFLYYPWEFWLRYNLHLDLDYNLTFLSIRSLIGLILILIFFGCSFGLSYDIMSGGDQFIELRGFFHYFRRYWWQYILLSVLLISGKLIYNIIVVLIVGNDPIEDVLYWTYIYDIIIITEKFFLFVWVTVFIQIFPSLTAQKGIKHAVRENFHLLRFNSRRIFASLFLFFIIFDFPWVIPKILFSLSRFPLFARIDIELWWHLEFVAYFAQATFYFIFAIPMLTLINTRIYNSLTYVVGEVDDKK